MAETKRARSQAYAVAWYLGWDISEINAMEYQPGRNRIKVFALEHYYLCATLPNQKPPTGWDWEMVNASEHHGRIVYRASCESKPEPTAASMLREVVLAVLESKAELARDWFNHQPDGPWVISQAASTSIDRIERVADPAGGYKYRVWVSGEDRDEIRVLSPVQLFALIGELAPVDLRRALDAGTPRSNRADSV